MPRPTGNLPCRAGILAGERSALPPYLCHRSRLMRLPKAGQTTLVGRHMVRKIRLRKPVLAARTMVQLCPFAEFALAGLMVDQSGAADTIVGSKLRPVPTRLLEPTFARNCRKSVLRKAFFCSWASIYPPAAGHIRRKPPDLLTQSTPPAARQTPW